MTSRISRGSRAVGCLLCGALGDALGLPVDSMDLESVRREYGLLGVRELETDTTGFASIGSDTQLTLFVAEGLLKISADDRSRHSSSVVKPASKSWRLWSVLLALHRWLVTQGEHPNTGRGSAYEGLTGDAVDRLLDSGNLVRIPRLAVKRNPAPGCLEALRTGSYCSPSNPALNPGAVCTLARVGAAGIIATDPMSAFRLGSHIIALTHGNPSCWVAAGAYALFLSLVMQGNDPESAARKVANALPEMARMVLPDDGRHGHGRTIAAFIETALDLVRSGKPSTAATLDLLGNPESPAWSFAAALFIALSHPDDVPSALQLAVNHSGPRSATASLCGQILGATGGEPALPAQLVRRLELADEIRRLAIGLDDNRGLLF